MKTRTAPGLRPTHRSYQPQPIEVITITPQQHFKQTEHYQNPKIRWFNGHFITAKQLEKEVME